MAIHTTHKAQLSAHVTETFRFSLQIQDSKVWNRFLVKTVKKGTDLWLLFLNLEFDVLVNISIFK